MRAGVYIDAMRLHAAASRVSKDSGFRCARPDYEAVLVECLALAKLFAGGEDVELERQAIYVASNGSRAFVRALKAIGFEVSHHAYRETGHCPVCSRSRDNWSWDCKMALDVTSDALRRRVDVAVIASGSATHLPLFELLDTLEVVCVATGYGGTISPKLSRRHLLPTRTLYEGTR